MHVSAYAIAEQKDPVQFDKWWHISYSLLENHCENYPSPKFHPIQNAAGSRFRSLLFTALLCKQGSVCSGAASTLSGLGAA